MAAKITKTKSKRKNFEIELEYETTISYECPLRGKVTQKVKIKKYESPDHIHSFDSDTSLIDNLRNQSSYVEED